MIRHRELGRILPALSGMGVFLMVVTSRVAKVISGLPRLRGKILSPKELQLSPRSPIVRSAWLRSYKSVVEGKVGCHMGLWIADSIRHLCSSAREWRINSWRTEKGSPAIGIQALPEVSAAAPPGPRGRRCGQRRTDSDRPWPRVPSPYSRWREPNRACCRA